MLKWIDILHAVNVQHGTLYTPAEVGKFAQNPTSPTFLGAFVSFVQLQTLFDRLLRLQATLRSSPSCTHAQLLQAVSPRVAFRYRDRSSTHRINMSAPASGPLVLARFLSVDGHGFEVSGALYVSRSPVSQFYVASQHLLVPLHHALPVTMATPANTTGLRQRLDTLIAEHVRLEKEGAAALSTHLEFFMDLNSRFVRLR